MTKSNELLKQKTKHVDQRESRGRPRLQYAVFLNRIIESMDTSELSIVPKSISESIL